MIFLRAAQREFAQTALAVFIAVLAIMLTTQLIRLLGRAASGAITPESVAALLGFATLNYLPVLLSLTMFIAILLTLARVWRDAEMAIWFSSGLALTAWIKPVLRFALPGVAAIAALALFLSPWALAQRAEYQQRIEQRDEVSRITPGVFNESARGDRVFFVEAVPQEAASAEVRNIFISSFEHGRQGVVVAAQGRVETAANGDRFIVLEQGRRYEGAAGATEYRVMEFERYAVRIEAAEPAHAETSAKAMPTHLLLQSPTPAHLGELTWRLGVPLSALLLCLLAIPLSFVNPRAGRTYHLIHALLVFMIYNNLLSVSQTWVAQGRLSFTVGVAALHGTMLLILLLMFWQRQTVFSWRRGLAALR